MKLEQFQSMVRIEYTAGEEATAVVRLPVLAASDVLLTGGLNVYWASAVLALPEPLKYTYKGMPAKVDPKPTEQPANPAANPASVETIQPMGVVEVDLVALLKNMQFPSGTYCFRRATPMDKLLVQPAPNRVLKQEHLNLLYHQLLYIQQELCEVKFIRAEVIRDGTYNGGVLEDPKVTPDPEQPNTGDTGSTKPKPKPKPEPDVDTETQVIPMAEHLTTQGYTIAYIHNGVPVIFGKAPFKQNKRGQQIDSNGYLTLSQTDTQLRVLNKATAFTTYADAVGIRPEASVLNAAGYTKDSAGKYYAVLPRIQTTVLPSNSPNGRFEEVYKDANGYSIEYTAEAGTGNYKWFVRLADPKEKAEAQPEHNPELPKPPKPNEDSGSTGTVTPSEPAPVEPSPARPEPAPEPASPQPETTDRGARVMLVRDDTPLPKYRARNDNDYMPAYGYTRNKFGNYPAIEPITKYVAADDASTDLKAHLPVFVDAENSVLKWVTEEDPETMRQESHWVVDYKDILY